MKRIPLLTVLALTAVPLQVAAQLAIRTDSARSGMLGSGPMMEEMMRPMAQVRAFSPERLLARARALGLTAQQTVRLTALRDGARSAVLNATGEAAPLLDRMLREMGAAAPNTGAVQTYFNAARESMEGARWSMFSAALRTKAVLTEAQRRTEQAWVDSTQASVVWFYRHQTL
jgi:hypothetical protein